MHFSQKALKSISSFKPGKTIASNLNLAWDALNADSKIASVNTNMLSKQTTADISVNLTSALSHFSEQKELNISNHPLEEVIISRDSIKERHPGYFTFDTMVFPGLNDETDFKTFL